MSGPAGPEEGCGDYQVGVVGGLGHGLHLCPLPVRAQAKVRHYRISTAADGSLYLQKGLLFPNLEELLTYYQANWKLIRNPLLQPCVRQVSPSRPHCLPGCPLLGRPCKAWGPTSGPLSTLCLGPCPGLRLLSQMSQLRLWGVLGGGCPALLRSGEEGRGEFGEVSGEGPGWKCGRRSTHRLEPYLALHHRPRSAVLPQDQGRSPGSNPVPLVW